MPDNMTLDLTQEAVDWANALLRRDDASPDHKDDKIIIDWTVAFGEGLEVDITLINGNAESSPYLKGDLYYKPTGELLDSFTDTSKVGLNGTYTFHHGADEYVLDIQVAEVESNESGKSNTP